MGALIELAETGPIPDRLTRAGIRQLLRKRLRPEAAHWTRDPKARHAEFEQAMRGSPVFCFALARPASLWTLYSPVAMILLLLKV